MDANAALASPRSSQPLTKLLRGDQAKHRSFSRLEMTMLKILYWVSSQGCLGSHFRISISMPVLLSLGATPYLLSLLHRLANFRVSFYRWSQYCAVTASRKWYLVPWCYNLLMTKPSRRHLLVEDRLFRNLRHYSAKLNHSKTKRE